MSEHLTSTLLACAALNASVQSHGHHFAQQQAQERHFVRRLSSLCDLQGEDSFLNSLQALLKPMLNAIAKHTHSAFYVKAACTSIADELLYPYESEEMLCTVPLLEHEPFNLAEGEFINSLIYRLFQHGPKLICTNASSDAPAAHLVTVEKELEDALATHRSNMAMEKLWEQFADRCAAYRQRSSVELHVRMRDVNEREQKQLWDVSKTLQCTEAGSACALAREAAPTSEQIRVLIEEALQRTPSCCSSAAPEDSVSSQSCSTQHVVDAFGNDTLILVEVARSALEPLSSNPQCTATRPGVRTEWMRLANATSAIRAHLKTPDPSGLITALALGTIYHKFVPYCGSGFNDGTAWKDCYGRCDSCGGAASTPVFDLVPSASDTTPLRRAQSPHGRTAASALAAYRTLGQHLTKLRTRLLDLMYDFPAYRTHEWRVPIGSYSELLQFTHQKLSGSSQIKLLCDLVEDTIELPALLSHVLHKLRSLESAGDVDVVCVASRRWLSLSSAPPSLGLPAIGSPARQMLERVVAKHFGGSGGNLEIAA